MEALLKTFTPEQMEKLLKTLTTGQIEELILPHILINKREELNNIFGSNYKYRENDYRKYIEFFKKYKDTDFYIIVQIEDCDSIYIQNILFNNELLEYYTKEALEIFEFRNNKFRELIKCRDWLLYNENVHNNKTIFCLSNLDNVHLLNNKYMCA